jgi:hypothetical protein
MTQLLDILHDYLTLRPQYNYLRLDGSVGYCYWLYIITILIIYLTVLTLHYPTLLGNYYYFLHSGQWLGLSGPVWPGKRAYQCHFRSMLVLLVRMYVTLSLFEQSYPFIFMSVIILHKLISSLQCKLSNQSGLLYIQNHCSIFVWHVECNTTHESCQTAHKRPCSRTKIAKKRPIIP